jgi:hypothetical protein
MKFDIRHIRSFDLYRQMICAFVSRSAYFEMPINRAQFKKILISRRAIAAIICVLLWVVPAYAQSKKERIKHVRESNIGLKPKGDRSLKGNSNENSHNPTLHQNNESLVQNNTIGEDLTNWNYDNLSVAVKQQINHNKEIGKPLSEGIIKEYRIEIKQCLSSEACQNTLSFLLNEKDIISFEYLEGHFVNIRVELSMKSEKLKEILSSKSLDFGFINENFLIRDTEK